MSGLPKVSLMRFMTLLFRQFGYQTSPKMITEIVDNNLTGIAIMKTFDKFQGLVKKNGKKIYIPNQNESYFDGFGG